MSLLENPLYVAHANVPFGLHCINKEWEQCNCVCEHVKCSNILTFVNKCLERLVYFTSIHWTPKLKLDATIISKRLILKLTLYGPHRERKICSTDVDSFIWPSSQIATKLVNLCIGSYVLRQNLYKY